MRPDGQQGAAADVLVVVVVVVVVVVLVVVLVVVVLVVLVVYRVAGIPTERSREDVDLILARLQNLRAFGRFHPCVLQQICLWGFYECLERGITLYRQGDIGTSWYTVLSGSLDVKVSQTTNHQSVLDNAPRHATIVTRESSELLRLGQKDFRSLWGVSDSDRPSWHRQPLLASTETPIK
ncbi:hypothetical protein CRUP_038417 [Coryphaenoides rupestris]|nr:hypothetical protein CRUP_038417 [Coryphaenoides rupestris]